MHSDHPEVRHHKKPVMQRFEGALGPLMVVVVIALAIGMIYTIATGDRPPSYFH
jgi:predicted homoserine dehydrogenase-like protein